MTALPLSRAAAPPVVRAKDPIRVMLVDDSAVIRGLVTRFLESDPEIAVVASAGDGKRALDSLARHPVDIVILDIEMPVMDGLTALPRLVAAQPGIKVIVASTLTRRNAETSLKALAAGAVDYIAKPETGLHSAEDFRRELLAKVKALGGARRPATVGAAQVERSPRPEPAARPVGRAVAAAALHAPPGQPIQLRAASRERPEAIFIGSSTGGPQALNDLMKTLAPGLTLPVLVTQHMPATFTTILAEHLSRQCGVAAAEAVDGEPIRAGRIYIAPGGYHMLVEAGADKQGRVRLNQDPPENFCRPAVDPMLRSAAATYRGRILTIILTGMGQDGLKGGRAVVEAGGTIIAQDEATSVVWGMPGAVATAGLCSAVLPLSELGAQARRLARL
jgi:two-component system chemotaxis response regulator CheB